MSLLPRRIYELLLERFGFQGWWPTTVPGGLQPRYRKRAYRKKTEAERFEICVGALLTQNTAWKNVEKALANLHRAKVLSVERIAGMKTGLLAELIRPSGYYNQKALRLRDFARYLEKNYGGKVTPLLARPLREARKELLSLKGIGPETADSMLLYAGARTSFVVDAYTRRLSGRLGWKAGEKYDDIKLFFEKNLPEDLKLYNEYHALIVALGKDFCKTKPVCSQCPLRSSCPHGTTGTRTKA